MKRRTLIVIVAAALMILVSVSITLANGVPGVDWWVIAGGGAQVTNGAYTLDGTLGQAVVGLVNNNPYELCSGFWCGLAAYQIYLPLILR